MEGHLYKVVNTVNGKVYIGKTYSTIGDRWARHKYDAFRLDPEGNYKYDFKFYRAIRKYGTDAFDIYDLGTFEESLLEEKEIEYIEICDSYRNGYNSTLGGDGNKLYGQISVDDIQQCIAIYDSGERIEFISKLLGLPYRDVAKIVRDNCTVRDNKYRSKPIAMLSEKREFQQEFESLYAVYKWLCKNYNPNVVIYNVYYLVKKAALSGNTAYGHKWKFI